MTKPRVLLIGATGRTGGSILNCLLEAGNFSVEVLIRSSSSTKPSVLALKDLNIKIHIADISDSAHLAEILTGINTVISAIGPTAHNEQIPLADAAKKTGCEEIRALWLHNCRTSWKCHVDPRPRTY